MDLEYLIVDQWGAFVGKHSERIQVRLKDTLLHEVPLMKLNAIFITCRGVSISADAITACSEAGIPIHFIRSSGYVSASIYAAGLIGTVQTRRAQLQALSDPRGICLAKAFAGAKIFNQAALLRYMAKYRKQTDPDTFRELQWTAGEILDHIIELERLDGPNVDAIRSQILSAEGRAAEKYWKAIRLVVNVPADWTGRVGRGAQDPFNTALNYAYGILYAQVERAVILAGLDPYAGFLHADRAGKPSLVLDLIEEFRTPGADRVIFAMANRNMHLDQDEEKRLTTETRRTIAEQVLERLEKPERYGRKKMLLRHIIQEQARRMATFLRGERPSYSPFTVRW
ncbi:MAG: CRISPR-associated endonuclease Cas1 [Anaerolineae bacterium]